MVTLFFLSALICSDDGVAVGPEVGKPVPDLKTIQVVGDHAGKEINWKNEAKDKATLFVFIRSDKWDRPTARLLKKLDDALGEDRQKQTSPPTLVIIWTTKEVDKAKEYLPRAQMSINLTQTVWSVYAGEKSGPTGWNIDVASSVTAVVADGPKVVKSFDYISVNDTVVPDVLKVLPAKK